MLVMIVTPCARRPAAPRACAPQQRVVAGVGDRAAPQLRQGDGALGQAFEHQGVELPALGQVLGGSMRSPE
jgi:hypothetical protein